MSHYFFVGSVVVGIHHRCGVLFVGCHRFALVWVVACQAQFYHILGLALLADSGTICGVTRQATVLGQHAQELGGCFALLAAHRRRFSLDIVVLYRMSGVRDRGLSPKLVARRCRLVFGVRCWCLTCMRTWMFSFTFEEVAPNLFSR